MNEAHIARIGRDTRIASVQIRATATLLEGGATVPFIARYRKEATGSLDEVAITTIRDRLAQLLELDRRREAILRSLEERGLLTDVLNENVRSAQTMTELEDIYLPYRPKRRTRATVAREKGLEPLAQVLWAQGDLDPLTEAEGYVDEEKGVENAEDALAGARDIIAEWVNEDMTARSRVRVLFAKKGVLRSKVVKNKEEEGNKYRDYFDWEELLSNMPSHRVLAVMRGEKESFLSVHIIPSEDEALEILEGLYIRGDNLAAEQVRTAIRDGYKRLLAPSMGTELFNTAKNRADQTAIQVFADNLRELLLDAPLGRRNILAADPGFRSGAKLVCLDRQGKLLHNGTIYPLLGAGRAQEAGNIVRDLVKRFDIEAIAVGNGTGGRETEAFFQSLDLDAKVRVVMVNESGASIYSASELAREELPDQDVTVRGAVSIGRRLMDPLSELVKIDPRSIGVGQYQHDVDQAQLKQRLDDVVVSCVNVVGVDVNTASKQLLTYVSGLGPQLAKSIIEYRNEQGAFENRDELKRVPRLGAKAFEQAGGFLRIEGTHPLDASAVHPERYWIVEQMAQDVGCSIADLMGEANLQGRIDLDRYVKGEMGLPTLKDIVVELGKPGRDPRREFEAFSFEEGINSIEDVKPGMTLPGVVTNVTAFGAFVDIGVHQDGLVHISQMSDRYVKNPSDVVKVHQRVMVTVMDVDLGRRRIALSMKFREQVV